MAKETVQVTQQDGTTAEMTLEPMLLETYFDIMRANEKTPDDLLVGQQVIFKSITAWTIKDKTTLAVLPVTMENLLRNVTLDNLNELSKTAARVNKIEKEQKKV